MDEFAKSEIFVLTLALLAHVRCLQVSDGDFQALCAQRCPHQNKSENHFDVGCGSECKIGQCSKGCLLWRKALESNCQTVCNGTQKLLSQKELHCVMGCNDAVDQYFQKLKDEIGTPPAPYLVADTLTATSLSLAWEGARYSEISYLVQWRYEEHAGAWQYCRNQSWGPSSVVLVENLQPYTKYRFRVALLLSPHSEPIVSEPSVVISTLAAGVPSSPPTIIRATAVDSKRISVSWKPGPFPNGPVHSYVVELAGDFVALKEDIPATKAADFYMFQNLSPNRKYAVSISMRNAAGEGPAATAEVVTPPEPTARDAPQPILILGSKHRVIKQGADMMLDAPAVIYETDRRITGVGIHVGKNLLFVSDAEGFVSVSTLMKFGEPRYLLTPYDLTFKPLDLSVDWLNQHLYVLGEVAHERARLWQVARCSLEGKGLTVAVAGLTAKPLHVEVDPYNGYLFWLIQGHNRGGLYRLDLANISNGIKHEVIPDVILEDPSLGAFVVDHVNFCILVPNHAKNTVYSVSLDGREVVDLRSNTQQPLFQNVLSLATANGLFYWTNGDEVLAEDYHEEYHTYFHNHYLGSKNRSYVSVHVDLPTSQPVPVPVNPPVHVQAVLGGRVAKVSWQTPHVVGGQGKGAWQNWSYELRITNEKTGASRIHREIANATSHTVEGLDDDTEYAFKAAAYTTSGNGPWSAEFRGKTIKTPANGRFPSLVWSAEEGLLESDVTGDEVETLLSRENLKDETGEYHFVDVSWYRDKLYLVTNTSKVHWYNMTSHDHGRIHNLESVGSVAVDWIGEKLYWSNPKQQLIIRGDLSGSLPEPLLILTIAKELNIDSEQAFIYWSTGHAVECARLNGEARRVYYPAELFSGKQVMGLTLNADDRHVYWIVRSNEGSNLFKAPMARSSGVTEGELEPTKISSLQHSGMQGPLCYFGDHLLWLRDNRNAMIGDLFGQNAAVVSGTSLSGLKTVAVLNWDSRSRLEEEVRVIPAPIDETSIRAMGTSAAFNITWDPVVNVNFGQVFYDVKTEDYARENLVKVVENELVYEGARDLLPYTEIRVTLQAFTYWGSSPRVARTIHSPPSAPGTPANPRVFVSGRVRAGSGEKEAVALVRWDPPADPNGVITAYRIRYFRRSEAVRQFSHVYLLPNELEWTLENLRENSTYVFQIQAFTVAGEGEFTKPTEVNSSFVMPVPTLLVVTKDSIKLMDCDSEARRTLSTGDRPTDVTLNSHEGWIYWLNEMQEIVGMKLDGSSKTKVHALNGTGLSLAIDWVGRFLYWSELEEQDSANWCSIHRLDLTQTENGISRPERVVRRNGRIEDLEVSPFTSTLYWIEVNRRHGGGRLMQSRTDGRFARPLFSPRAERFGRECTCPENPRTGKTLAVDQTDPYNAVIIYSDEWQGQVYRTEPGGCDCAEVARLSAFSPTSIATDHRHLYWLNETEDAVFLLKQDSEVRAFAMEGVKKITAVGSHLQPFPPSECLTAREYPRAPRLLESTATSVLLELDEPERLPECENISLPSVRYVVHYDAVDDVGSSPCARDLSSCKSVLSYRSPVKVENLKPFSRYAFSVSLRNYLGNGSSAGPPVVFSTLAGAPPPPRNLTVTVLSPTVLEVTWLSSRKFPFDAVWHQVHWRSEEAVSGVRQSGEQILEGFDPRDPPLHAATVHKLMPGQTYLVWVRAYSKLSSAYSESEKVEAETFSQPGNITLVRATPYSLELAWTPPDDAFHGFRVQFRHFPGFETWENVSFVDGDDEGNGKRSTRWLVENLSPKSSYRFRLVIAYAKSKQPYVWPRDGFEFETLGDRPSRPGTPVIQQLRKDVYQVLWEKSRDNGAVIDCYALEGLVRKAWRRKRETHQDGSPQDPNGSAASEQWTLYYNGTENYWIIDELSPSLKYVFRVKAKNHFGWSDFSETSKSFDFAEAAMLASQEELGVVLGTTVPLLFLCCLVVLAVFCCVTKMREKEKKEVQILTLTTGNRGPDVELATLRELPRRGNFIHNANVLYSASGPAVDEEISLLPHVRREQFKLTKFLGSGAFGEVYEGVAQDLPAGTNDVRVAIKALRKGATDHEKTEFLKEALLMSHFKHEHILQLLGVCLDNDPNYILMELMEGGDLLSYLRTNRPLLNTSDGLTLRDLLEMCLDVTKGCRYLEEMHFVHRDLACRNCLVSSADPATRIVKIGDFGLARDIYKNDYYRKEGEGLLPVRWMAPESLVDGVFTSQSDVWAFGVLIWEIMTLGQQPYPARTNLEVLHYVRSGGRLGKPNDCPEKLHRLMMKCWSFNPESRPTFKYCLEVFKDLKEGTESAALSAVYGENYSEARTDRRAEDEEEGGAESEDTDGNSGGERKPRASEVGSGASEPETESSSVTSGDPHQYLELVRGDEDPPDDGYEVPSLGNGAEDEGTSEGDSGWQTLTTAVVGLMTDSDAGRMDEFSNGASRNASFVASVFGAPACLGWEPVNHVYFQLANTFFFLSYLAPNGMYGILYLRCTLLVSCAFFALWGWAVLCSFDAFLWNSTFVVINFVQVCVLIYHLRPVKFTKEVEEVYAALFRPLKVTRHQFKKVLNCMKLIRQLKYQEVYAQERGTKVDSLSLVLSGKLVVSQNGRALHIVFPHQFLDSPEWFGVPTDDFFQVSITAMEESRVLIWHRDKLKLSIITDQFLQAVFDHILGRDVVKKLMQVSETMAATNGHLPNMEDGEDKPMLVIKKPGDAPGITALINRQFQGMPRMRYYYCASDPNAWRLGRIEETDHETPV